MYGIIKGVQVNIVVYFQVTIPFSAVVLIDTYPVESTVFHPVSISLIMETLAFQKLE